MIKHICILCSQEFFRRSTGKYVPVYCSVVCRNRAINKNNTGENNKGWKGSNVSYSGLHFWVERQLGKPKVCFSCGDIGKTRYVWANISGDYKRELDDWVRLCFSCHTLFDLTDFIKNRQRDSYGRFL